MSTENPTQPGRLSPLNQVHDEASAVFTTFAGWRMPVRYTSDGAEHRAVRTAAGLFDLSHMGEIVLVGPEAAQALDYALAGTLSALQPFQAKYSLLLNTDGGILDDVIVYRTGEDRFMVVANAANTGTVLSELTRRAESFDTLVSDESADIALLAIQGPLSNTILAGMSDFRVDDGTARSFVQCLTDLRYYRSFPATWAGEPVLIARTGYTGEDGFELYTSPDKAPALWDALVHAGAEHGLIPAGLASRDTLRLEAGMPLYGHELTTQTTPVRAGLGRVVDFSKPGDFVGRTALEREPDESAPVLVGLVGEGKRAAREGYDVVVPSDDGQGTERVGVITSGVLSPTLGVPLAMAYVTPPFATVGTTLSVDIRGSLHDFTVTHLPFYRRKKNEHGCSA